MNALATITLESITNKVHVTPLGLVVAEELTFDEWSALAPHLGDAARSMAFVVGDWLAYGDRFAGQRPLPGFEDMPSRVPHGGYDKALAATKLDFRTLVNFAYVARYVKSSCRHELLSFEHHRAVAKLDESKQKEWLAIAAAQDEDGQRMSVRRLRRSVEAGRVIPVEDMRPDPADAGIINHMPFVNRLSAWWGRMRASGWLKTATKEQRAALKRDLQPIVEIHNQL